MVDQTSQFYAILTSVGAAKQANADALGIAWKITQMAVGDGNPTGLENPPLPMPDASARSLLNEWRRAPLNQLKVDENDGSIIVAEQVIPADVGGRWIRELALFDADGDMIAVANCPPTYKPLLDQGSGRTQVVRMNLIVSSSSNVQLKIDPSVVLATREWVTEELAKQDFKHSVAVATTASIALSGLQTVDGVALTAGARVLVKNQAAAKDNGIYLVVAGGAWTRCPDADTSAKVTPGMLVPVERGTVNADSLWQLVSDGPIALGVSALAYEMAFGRTGVAAGTYRSVTVDTYGRVVAATNPTTVAGYGLTDVYTKTQVDQLLALKAPLVSPALTGSPTAPTVAGTDSSTKLATSAAVRAIMAQFGLGSAGATVLEDFKAINPGGLYLAYGALVPNLATPNAPPESDNKVLAVLAVTPRPDCMHYLAFETGTSSSNRSYWVGQYTLPGGTMYWSRLLSSDQIATQPQVDAGTLDNVVVTPKTMRWGFSASLGANGYLFLPSWLGGVCIQWGYEVTNATGTTHSFPIAFPNSVFQIIGSDRGVITLETIALEVASTTQYRARSSGATPGFAYLAIGR